MPSSVSVSYSDILGDTTWGCGGRLMHFALHYAAKYGNSEVVELLLEATVPVSAHQRTVRTSHECFAMKSSETALYALCYNLAMGYCFVLCARARVCVCVCVATDCGRDRGTA
eukprot:m.630301 g.630301  ORF g.630301 m.630301 type:complete len:113 (+) comp22565_c2_seq25:1064-1402(+)